MSLSHCLRRLFTWFLSLVLKSIRGVLNLLACVWLLTARQESLFRKSRTSSLREKKKAESIDSVAAKSNYAFCHFSSFCDYLEAHVLVSFPFSFDDRKSETPYISPSSHHDNFSSLGTDRSGTDEDDLRLLSIDRQSRWEGEIERQSKSSIRRQEVRKRMSTVCLSRKKRKERKWREREITMHTLPSSFRRFGDQYFVYWNVFLFKCLSLRIGMG